MTDVFAGKSKVPSTIPHITWVIILQSFSVFSKNSFVLRRRIFLLLPFVLRRRIFLLLPLSVYGLNCDIMTCAYTLVCDTWLCSCLLLQIRSVLKNETGIESWIIDKVSNYYCECCEQVDGFCSVSVSMRFCYRIFFMWFSVFVVHDFHLPATLYSFYIHTCISCPVNYFLAYTCNTQVYMHLNINCVPLNQRNIEKNIKAGKQLILNIMLCAGKWLGRMWYSHIVMGWKFASHKVIVMH